MRKHDKIYVQYGCGFCAPPEWLNFDASPTLRFERTPFIGILYTKNKQRFPDNVRYGDITKGLRGIKNRSCDGVFCSHVLEHLSQQDCRLALKNTYVVLKDGGIFRCVVPDLEHLISEYLDLVRIGDRQASNKFMKKSGLGMKTRPKGLLQKLSAVFGHARHLWFYDARSLEQELLSVGFTEIREAKFHDSADPMFCLIEEEGRFKNALAFEARK